MIAKPRPQMFAALWFVAGNCVWLPAFGLGLLLFGGAMQRIASRGSWRDKTKRKPVALAA